MNFLMVIMASGISRGRVRTTTATESRKMAAILQIINNYSPKWRWLAVDIYRAAKRRGKYPTLATDTEVNSCFSIY